MWRVVDNLYDDDECRPYFNKAATVKGYTPAYLNGRVKSDILRKAFPHQEKSFEYEGWEILKLEQELVPFGLKIVNDSASAIVKVYGAMEIETNGSSTTTWYLLYKKKYKNGSNNSELSLVKPHMNCKKMINVIGILYDYKNLTKPLSSAEVTCFGTNTDQLQIVDNNEMLNIYSKVETIKKLKMKKKRKNLTKPLSSAEVTCFGPNTVQLQTVDNNEMSNIYSKRKNTNWFSILPNEVIAKMFEYFDLKTLARTAQVCFRFNDIITKTDELYYNLDFRPYWSELSKDVFDRFMDKTKNLKKLHLGWCNVIPNEIYDLKFEKFLNGAKNTVTHLYIDRNRLSYVFKESLIKTIFACIELLELHLRHVDLRLHCNDEWSNTDVIRCRNLRTLDLSFSRMSYSQLIEIISKNRKLKHLILDFSTFGTESPSEDMDNILQKLIEFDINLETWSSCVHLPCYTLSLIQFHTNLEELDLAGRCRNAYLPPTTFNFLAKCSRLKRLSLAYWKIKDEHLVTVIENCKKLEQVNISFLSFITANSIKGFLKLENFKLLNIINCTLETISLSQIQEWRKEYPQVQIRSHLK